MRHFVDGRASGITSMPSVASYALALSLFSALAGCKEEQTGKVEEAVRPVKVAVVGPAVQEHTLTYSGVVRARVESAVGFRVAGKIVERLVNTGDTVEVGQVVARLDDTDLKLAERSAWAAVESARTRHEVAIDNFERARRLLPSEFVPKATYDTRKSEMDAAAAAFRTAESQLHQATNAVGYATLRADKDGVVIAVMAEPGQVVNAGTPVFMLAEAGETEIAFAVPEQEVVRLMPGRPIELALWAAPQTTTDGRIREISAQADPASRTYAVRATVPKPPAAMRLGMTASIRIKVQEPAASVVVPVTALAEIEGKAMVYIVEPQGRIVRKRLVTLGDTAPEGVKIASGLQAGSIVVTAGVQFLRDGMRVRLPDDAEELALNATPRPDP